MQEKKYLTKWKMIAYGCGDVASTFTYTFISGFIMMFLTDIMGLNSAIIGSLILVSKILDGITDVIAGTIIDRTKKKIGKAKYWMLVTAIPLALTCVLLFFIPTNATATLQYAYFFIVYSLMCDIFYTLYYVAYGTLGVLMTRNKNEQMTSGVVRYMMVMVASLIVSSASIALVNAFGGGVAGWRMTAIIYGAIFILLNLVLLLKVEEHDEFANDAAAQAPQQKIGLVQSAKILIRNPYFINYTFICIIYNAVLTMNSSVGVFFMKYILGDESLLGLFTLSMMSIVVGIMFAPMLEKKIGIYKMTLYGWIVSCVLDIGFIAGAHMHSLALMLIFNILRWAFIGPYAASNIAICSEIAKHSYLKNGVHLEASCNGCTSMGTKIGGGIGTAIMGWLLDASGYVANAPVQPAGTNQMLIFMYAVLPFFIHIILTVLFGLLKVEKANKTLEQKA